MDEKPDSRDDQEHDASQRVDQIGEIDCEVTAEDPFIGDDFTGGSGSQGFREDGEHAEERHEDRTPCKAVSQVMRIAVPKEAVHQDGHQRKQGNQFYDQVNGIGHVTTSINSFRPRWSRSSRGTRQ